MWKRFVNDYLSYTYKERTGIFILLALITSSIFLPFLYPLFISAKQYDHSKFKAEIAQLQRIEADSLGKRKYYVKKNDEDNFTGYALPTGTNNYPKTPSELFYFDPNTATAAEWKRLGVKDKTIGTIQKYVSKGGHFNNAEDISKIWGLHPEDIKRLLPYVSIAKSPGYQTNAAEKPAMAKQAAYIAKALTRVDVNTADTSEFIALPGIGSKLAVRIVNFRNKLGGFYSVDQVGETFGLADSTFQKLRSRLNLSTSTIKKINLNVVLLDDLKTHPYIRYAIANAIIQYRTLHGNFMSLGDVKKIMLVTNEVYNKMEPYFTVNE